MKTDFATVKEAVNKANEGVIWLPASVCWAEFHDLLKEINFVVSEKLGQYRINTVRVSSSSFKSKRQLPESWAGLRGTNLDAISGIKGGVFVHKCRFLGIWDSREGISKVLEVL